MSQWIHVCSEQDLEPGMGVCASVRGHQVAVFRLSDNRYFGIDNHDPFSKANVLSRGLTGDVGGRPVITSPIYKQHFDLVTGQCLEDDDICLDVYDVKILDGSVHVYATPHQVRDDAGDVKGASQ